mmetsp:Transcript_15015/g.20084  ORF Transcript_15015/g.20084 Transcript_15015/m.20084 type:complete len:86 (-) Transcript_15015:29-286(-)
MRNRLASDAQQRDSSRSPYWDDLIQTSVTSHRFHVPDESGGMLQKSSSLILTDLDPNNSKPLPANGLRYATSNPSAPSVAIASAE